MVRISWYMNWTWRVNNLSTEMVWNATCHSDWSYLLREDNNGVHLNLEASDLLCQRVQQSFILGPAIGLHLALHVVQIWYSVKGHVHWAVTSAHALHAQDKFNHDYDDHSVFGFIIIVKGLKGKSSLLVIVATRTTISDDSPLIIKSFDQKFKFKTWMRFWS